MEKTWNRVGDELKKIVSDLEKDLQGKEGYRDGLPIGSLNRPHREVLCRFTPADLVVA
jgi:hypothetical protein